MKTNMSTAMILAKIKALRDEGRVTCVPALGAAGIPEGMGNVCPRPPEWCCAFGASGRVFERAHALAQHERKVLFLEALVNVPHSH